MCCVLLCAVPRTMTCHCMCGTKCLDLQKGRTALICAAAMRRTDCLRLLLEAGADQTAKDKVRVAALLSQGARMLRIF